MRRPSWPRRCGRVSVCWGEGGGRREDAQAKLATQVRAWFRVWAGQARGAGERSNRTRGRGVAPSPLATADGGDRRQAKRCFLVVVVVFAVSPQALRTRLWPYMHEAPLSVRLLTNHLTRWQVSCVYGAQQSEDPRLLRLMAAPHGWLGCARSLHSLSHAPRAPNPHLRHRCMTRSASGTSPLTRRWSWWGSRRRGSGAATRRRTATGTRRSQLPEEGQRRAVLLRCCRGVETDLWLRLLCRAAWCCFAFSSLCPPVLAHSPHA